MSNATIGRCDRPLVGNCRTAKTHLVLSFFNRRTKMSVLGTLIRLAIVVTGVCSLNPLNAAEITNSTGTIILEGQIEPGDYNKLRDDLFLNRGYNSASEAWCPELYGDTCPHEIFLASPGGNVGKQ